MKYSADLTADICALFATGEHKVADVCQQCGISESQFYAWQEKPEFSDAIKSAKKQRLLAFAGMARSGLAKLLDVYEYEETTTESKLGKDDKPRVVSVKKVKKFVMPNATAIIFTLKNREAEEWKDKHEVEVKDITPRQLSDADLAEIAAADE